MVAPHLDTLYRQVREILSAARARAWQAVNAAMVEAYWGVGRVIVEEEQAGRERADYGKRVIEGLAERLKAEFVKGYDRSNLFHMRAFFLAYPKFDAVRRQLSWTHYRLLLRVDHPDARAFYEAEAASARRLPNSRPGPWPPLARPCRCSGPWPGACRPG